MSVPPESADAAVHLRVLYVEDNRINAILFEEAMRMRPHFELRLAEDGDEALLLVRRWRPDVLVLDSHLPGMSGFELLLALRKIPALADVPAYMCSADAWPDDVQRAVESGFAGYWPKPVDLEQMFSDLDHLCTRLSDKSTKPAADGS